MSNPNRTFSTPGYKVPPGWEKGEPLSIVRVSETCYQLYRSGSYLQVPGAPITNEVQCLEFPSRVDMMDFQRWWDTPAPTFHNHLENPPHFWLTYAEFVEVLQEMFHLDLREILGNRQGVNKVPPFTMAIQVAEDQQAKDLGKAHEEYISRVRAILGVPGPDAQVDG